MKLTTIAAALGAVLAGVLATGCSSEEPGMGAPGNVTFSISLPASAPTSRTAGDLQLVCVAYDHKDGKYAGAITVNFAKPNETKTVSVEIPLALGSTYDMAFWASEAEAVGFKDDTQAAYKFVYEASPTVTAQYGNMSEGTVSYDAFCGSKTEVNPSNSQPISVTLTRPLAQVNLGTADLQDPTVLNKYPDGVKTALTVKTACNTLSLLSGEVTGSIDATYPAQASTEADYPVGGNKYLASRFVLAPATSTVHECQLSFSSVNDPNIAGTTLTVPNVPICRNYQSNIYGSLLTSNLNYTVEISGEIGGTTDLSWDGTTIKRPRLMDAAAKTVTIQKPEEWMWLAKALNGETVEGDVPSDLSQYAINLNNPLDMGGHEIPMIKRLQSELYGHGYTISNFKIAGGGAITSSNKYLKSSYRGLVGLLQGGSISNLTIADAQVTNSKGGAGVIVGIIDAGTVTNCKVYNCTASALEQAGGIAGCCFGGGSIDSCEVHDCEITSSAEPNNYRLDLSGAGGVAGGMVEQSNSIKHCTVTENTRINSIRSAGGMVGFMAVNEDAVAYNIVSFNTVTGGCVISGIRNDKFTRYGDNIGGLVGLVYSYAQIEDNHVNHCTIQGYGDIGVDIGFTLSNGDYLHLNRNVVDRSTVTLTDLATQ